MSVLQASKNYVWVSLIFLVLCIGGICDTGIISLIMFVCVIYFATRIKYVQEGDPCD